MKRFRIAALSMAVCVVLGLVIIPINHISVQAEEIIATITGTVLTGTTSELIQLSTKDGKVEIKLDSRTDTNSFKTIIPDKKINVSVTQDADKFLRAVKITSAEQTGALTLDYSTKTSVTGTLGEKTKGDVLYLNTPQGEMQIKLDTDTCFCDCSVLVPGKTYNISCARGSDAFMHAISISDPGTGTGNSGTGNSGTTAGNTSTDSAQTAATMSVSGTVSERTKENILYLSTSGGEMQFVIDSNADTSKGMVHTPGNKLTVSYYHGSDAYLHAVGIVGVKDSASAAEIDTSATSSVSGTVLSSSTESMLHLKTSGGEMQLKLDAVSSVNKCKVLVTGKKLTVTYARGSDAYMHAINISGE